MAKLVLEGNGESEDEKTIAIVVGSFDSEKEATNYMEALDEAVKLVTGKPTNLSPVKMVNPKRLCFGVNGEED